MDLRLTAKAPATEAERAAVDAVLGPPPPAGRAARAARRTRTPRSAAAPPAARRHLLITVLHAVQERVGWISPGALDYVCERLTVPPAEAFGVASFYALFRTDARARRGRACLRRRRLPVAGAEELCAAMARRFGREGTEAALWTAPASPGSAPRASASATSGSAALIQQAGAAAPGATSPRPPRTLSGRRSPAASRSRDPPRRARPPAVTPIIRNGAGSPPVPLAPPRRADGSRCCAASATSTPARSAPTGRRAATRCCAARSSSARRA